MDPDGKRTSNAGSSVGRRWAELLAASGQLHGRHWAGSHGRRHCRNEAAFARLAGVAPLEASSGQNTRHRLNRRGDRQLNRALHTIAVTRSRYCPHTQAYIAKRTAEGKTPREAQRCLKRYIARQIYRLLQHPKINT